MARRPDSDKHEKLTQKDLDELRYNLVHLSVDAIRRFYDRAHEDLPPDLQPTAITEANADPRTSLAAVVEATVAANSERVTNGRRPQASDWHHGRDPRQSAHAYRG